jgi:hypothetical protein
MIIAFCKARFFSASLFDNANIRYKKGGLQLVSTKSRALSMNTQIDNILRQSSRFCRPNYN